MEEKAFLITRESAPGVLSLVSRRMWAQIIQVHENIWFNQPPEKDVDPAVGLEITRAIILPTLLEARIIQEGARGKGYSTTYRHLLLDPKERQIFLEGMIPISESIATKAINKESLNAKASYHKGRGRKDVVEQKISQIVSLMRELHNVPESANPEENVSYELGYVSITDTLNSESKV